MASKILQLFGNWDDTAEFAAGAVIFAERDPADCMYLILAGEVDLTLHGEPLSTEGKGRVIGEMAMLGSKKREGTATARTDVRLARIDHDQFRDTMAMSTEFSLLVMSDLASRLRAVDRFILAGKAGKG
jgi:CRP/FNR family transcriptional regulator, cyclic AMP receptor protein